MTTSGFDATAGAEPQLAAYVPGAHAPAHRKPVSKELLERGGPVVLSVGSVLLAWWAIHLLYPNLMPGPWQTLGEAQRLVTNGTFPFHMAQSLRRVIVGFGLAMFASLVIGIYMGTVQLGERFFQPLVVLGLTIPGLMWALIAVMLFGLNEASSYAAVAVSIFPMLVINIWAGVKSLDKELIDMSNVFRFDAWSKIVDVIIPQLVPHIFAGTRYGLGLAWKVVVVVEMFGTSNGVGYQVIKAYQIFDMSAVIAWTLAFVAVMILIEYGIIGFLERRATAWRPRVDVWRR